VVTRSPPSPTSSPQHSMYFLLYRLQSTQHGARCPYITVAYSSPLPFHNVALTVVDLADPPPLPPTWAIKYNYSMNRVTSHIV
jgi:hypothetical protein